MFEQAKPWGYYALGSVVFSGAMMLGDLAQRQKEGEAQLAAAVAEADKLLPGGWHWPDVEKRRHVVPPEKNSALRIHEMGTQIPGAWPGEEIDKLLQETPAEHRFSREDLLRLQLRVADVKQALHTARGFLDRPDGRFPIDYKVEFIGTLVPDVETTRQAASVLRAAAIARAETGDADQALADCRAIFVMASWLRDEPCLICQLIRIAICTIGANTVERVLAQTEPSPAALAALQKLIADEELAPLPFRVGVEGELALNHRWLDAVRAGQAHFALDGPPKGLPGRLQEQFVERYLIPEGEAKLVRMMARVAAATRKPLPEQQAELARIEKEVGDVRKRVGDKPLAAASGQFGDVLVGLLMPAFQKVNEASIRHLAVQRTLQAVVAAERFRRDKGRWPEALAELVPAYLPAVPADPYDSRPLRLKRTAEGLAIYSVGPDRKDNGGLIDRQNPVKPGTDLGYRLWDVAKRRQPPLPPKPKSEDEP